MNEFTQLPQLIWFLDDSEFERITDNKELKLDKDFYPLLPNGNLELRFTNASSKPNLSDHYIEWSMRCSFSDKRYIDSNILISSLVKVLKIRLVYVFYLLIELQRDLCLCE
jgi:hypothetical protein